tara:strand:- start:48 stop:392 length:345 start_codon:yes stop_codon:yes gene_type:complete
MISKSDKYKTPQAESVRQTIAFNLKRLRKNANLTQQELANKVASVLNWSHFTFQQIQKYEKIHNDYGIKGNKINAVVLDALAKSLNVPHEEFYKACEYSMPIVIPTKTGIAVNG